MTQQFGIDVEMGHVPPAHTPIKKPGSATKEKRRSEVSNSNMSVFESCMAAVYGKREEDSLFSRCMQKPQGEGRQGDGDMGGGHVGKYVSLANNDAISKFSCHVPLLATLSITLVCVFLLFLSVKAFLLFFVLITICCAAFLGQMAVGSVLGRNCILRALEIDWVNEWEEFKKDRPGVEQGLLHIVILPNYKEDEDMMSDTVENIAESYLAKENTVVVLGMEAREGPGGQEKAERLIQRHRANFKEMFATYHPPNIPCEVAGKSSNTQWAFREVQRWFGAYVSQTRDVVDPSKVLVTVADADAVHHKHHWLNMSISALSMEPEERCWTIFQPPIVQFRNLETVPALIRLQAYATIFFEVSSLYYANWKWSMCFSAYTAPLQLLNHPMIDGWDTDVIAEDHHMFFKCSCASYWEQIHEKKKVESVTKLKLQPVWLPLSSYMAEDRAGWMASLWAKFQQARRHAQGVSEISYLFLQWCTLREATTSGALCPEANAHMIGNMVKYFVSVILTCIQGTVMMVLATGLNLYLTYEMLVMGADVKRSLWDLLNPDDFLLRGALAVIALYSPIIIGSLIFQTWLYVVDNLGGSWTPLHKTSHPVEGKHHEIATRPVGVIERAVWLVQIAFDYLGMGFFCQILWGTIPAAFAIIGLSKNGHKFEYIVAAKPEGQAKANKSSVVMGEPVGKGEIEMENNNNEFKTLIE